MWISGRNDPGGGNSMLGREQQVRKALRQENVWHGGQCDHVRSCRTL